MHMIVRTSLLLLTLTVATALSGLAHASHGSPPHTKPLVAWLCKVHTSKHPRPIKFVRVFARTERAAIWIAEHRAEKGEKVLGCSRVRHHP